MTDIPLPEQWIPTADAINALPEPLRRYIHDIETRCDPAGDIRELTLARDTIRYLEAQLREANEVIDRFRDGYAQIDEMIGPREAGDDRSLFERMDASLRELAQLIRAVET